MKSFLMIGFAFVAMLLAVPNSDAHAQNIMPKVTKITSTSTGTNVIFEDSAAKISLSMKKGTFYTRTVNYSGGTLAVRDIASGKTIWQGPVSGVRITGATGQTDSLKVLHIRQYLTN